MLTGFLFKIEEIQYKIMPQHFFLTLKRWEGVHNHLIYALLYSAIAYFIKTHEV